jgi:hypothetical protein
MVFFLIFVQGTIPRNAVGEMMPVRLATRIAVPDQQKTFLENLSEPVFLNVYEAQESIPRNEFRQPGGPVL